MQRRIARLAELFPPTVQRDPTEELQLQALLTLPMEELEMLQVVALRGGEPTPGNDAERFAMDHYREALLAGASERGVAA
jgi:hypothetical protein